MTRFGIFHCYKLCSFGKGISCSCGFCLALYHCPGIMNNQPLDARCSVEKMWLISRYVLRPVIFFINLYVETLYLTKNKSKFMIYIKKTDS